MKGSYTTGWNRSCGQSVVDSDLASPSGSTVAAPSLKVLLPAILLLSGCLGWTSQALA